MSGISERNPFVGPRPIEQGEPLHGRDVEVRELYNRLQARRIVVLHSPSGAGKSSLVQAGLIPRLAEGGYDVWKPIRVNLDPGDLEGIPEGTNRYLLSAMISLEEELPELNRRTPGALAGLEFIEYLEKRPRRKGRGGQPVVLIFDQFEEVLTVAALAVEAKRAFFTAVGQALESEKFWALFLIREDHLAAFAPYRDRIPTQMSNTFRLDLLGLAGAREAAQSLAAQGGRSFPAVDQLVHDLSRVQVQQADGSFVGEQGLYVEPVQLQVVCRRLWDAMPEDDLSIDPEDIAAYASVSEALGGYYADTVRAIAGGDDAVERSLRDWVGHKLIVGGIRSQLRQEVGKTAGLDNRLIARLLDSYLVRTEPRAGAHWFELSHDRLVEPVQKNDEAWDQAHLHPLQVQAKLWEDARRSAGLLLGAGALPGAQAWAREHPALLTAGEREFLELSRALRASEQAARRRLIALAVVAGLVAVGVGVLGVVAWGARGAALAAESKAQAEARRAEEATQRAEKARVRAENASLLAGARELAARGQPDLATRLLLAADRPEEVRGWSELAREILGRPMLQTELRGHEGEVTSATWSPDGRRVLTVDDDGAAWIWIADGTGEPVVLEREGQGVSAVAWSPDGSRLVIATEDNAARVLRADGSGEPVVLAGHTDIVASLVWSPTGERIVTVLKDGDAWVWRADATGQPVVLADEAELVGAAVWSPDGRRIVTVFGDMARVWDADGAGAPVVLKGHEDSILAAAWSPDGALVATCGFDGSARVWSAEGGPILLAPVVHGGMCAALELSAGHLVTGGSDGARLWRLPVEQRAPAEVARVVAAHVPARVLAATAGAVAGAAPVRP